MLATDMVFGRKKEEAAAGQREKKVRYFAVKAESILKNEISIDALAEPYVLISARREKVGNIMYVVNLLAHRRGYKVNSFAVSRFFSYVIMEKTTTTGSTEILPPPPTTEEESLAEEEEE